MITLGGLKKDIAILHEIVVSQDGLLQTQIKTLHNLVVSQDKRIKELEEVLFPDDPSDSFCGGKGENHEK